MSAKRRKATNSQLDFTPHDKTARAGVALRRALSIRLHPNVESVAEVLRKSGPDRTGVVGRPRENNDLLVAYEFDTGHLQTFRDAGWGNVPPNKTALYALAKRTGKSDNTIKVALRRARKEKRK